MAKPPEVLGIATVDDGRRVYFGKGMLRVLKLSIGDRISFGTSGKHVVISEANSGEGLKIGVQQRVYTPDEVMHRLKLSVGDEVIFLREGRRVTMSALGTRIK